MPWYRVRSLHNIVTLFGSDVRRIRFHCTGIRFQKRTSEYPNKSDREQPERDCGSSFHKHHFRIELIWQTTPMRCSTASEKKMCVYIIRDALNVNVSRLCLNSGTLLARAHSGSVHRFARMYMYFHDANPRGIALCVCVCGRAMLLLRII